MLPHLHVLDLIDEKLRRNQIEYNELLELRVKQVASICQELRMQFSTVYGIGKANEKGIIPDLGLFANKTRAENELLQTVCPVTFVVKQVESKQLVDGWLIKLVK